jgi:hypothetical protein
MNPLLWVFRFTFGHCHHSHLSRIFTIKHRTYKVCFDCGREFDLPDAHKRARSDASSGSRLGA